MRSYVELATVVALLALSSVLLVGAAPGRANNNNKHTKLAKMFDYEHYKQSFGKSYSSEAEDSNRRGCFYARALAAFVSGVNFKYRLANHYLALNEMSDWTPGERARTKNKKLGHPMITRSKARLEAQRNQPLAFMPAEGERPEETLLKFLEAHADQPKYRDLLDQLEHPDEPRRTTRLRQKRQTETEQGPREFSFDQLVRSREAIKPSLSEQLDEHDLPNRNKKYQLIEPLTRGLSNELEPIEYYTFVKSVPLTEELESSLGSLEERAKSKGDKQDGDQQQVKLKDEIFFDHRDSGCLSEVRAQGRCGSCYAFAATAIVEWLYCMKFKKLVAFSEQYMIDCGKEHITGTDGCDGGYISSAVEFIHNFGVELKSHYRYLAREGMCPYDKDTEKESTGFIRMELGKLLDVPVPMWAKVIEHTPLQVVIQTADQFSDYGGGVDDGSHCVEVATADPDSYELHAVVLVGHGREDGQEYWLIRNSYGADWGDKGYYKLSKDAPKDCISEQMGQTLGTVNGFDFPVRPRKNRHYDESRVAAAVKANQNMDKNNNKPKKGKNKKKRQY